MKVLLTGHKGYIGAVAAPILRAAGHTITGVDSDLFAGCDFGNGMAEIPELRKDIRDVSRTDLEGFDAVVHLAALSNDPLGNLNPEVTFEINHRATARLAELAKAAGVRRFVLSSSCSIYGAAGDSFLDESAELSPVTAYAVSKVRAEHDLVQLGDSHFSPVHLRNATAYGASPRLRLDVVLNDLVASAFATGRVYVKSDGTPWRPIVHVRDIAAAILSVLEAPIDLIHNETFNVGQTEENYRVSQLAEIVAETVPGCRIEYAPGGGPDRRCYRVNCEKIRRLLPAFSPQWTAGRGALELYQAYKGEAGRPGGFDCSRYFRVSHLRGLIDAGRLDASMRWIGLDSLSSRA